MHLVRSLLNRLSWTWLLRGLPALTPEAFGLFRVVFSLLLGATLLWNWEGDLPLSIQRDVPIASLTWLRDLAATPSGIVHVQQALLLGLVVFAAGVYSRAVFVALAVGFTLWFSLLSLRGVIHFLGPLPMAMLLMTVTPWHEGAGWDRTRTRGTRSSRISPGFAPWVLCLAFAIAFLAAGHAKGAQWAMNGTVRYHFMADADVAWVPWGPWVAARPRLAVLASWLVVIVEHLAILAPFVSPRRRAFMGLVVGSLIVGFVLMHNALWPAWWVLLLGFAPWHLVRGSADDQGDGRVSPATLAAVPVALVLLLLILPVQQIAASTLNLEAGPFLSAYDMYSTTYDSPEAFVRVNGQPRFRIMAVTPGGEVNVEACVRADEPAFHALESALETGRQGGVPVREGATRCAREAGATAVRITADQRFFDWERGATGWKFHDRVVGDWAVGS